jgi:hypothetical protein
VEAPFLNEIRISLRHAQNFFDCIRLEINAFVPRYKDISGVNKALVKMTNKSKLNKEAASPT